MRKSHSALRIGLIISTLVLALVLVFAWELLSFTMGDEIAKVKMKAYLSLNAGNLDQIGENARKQDKEGYASFFFDIVGPETSIELLYLPDDAYIPPEDPGWHLVSSTENSWRWEGGGVYGNGYINVECLKPKWYCVEECIPT